MKKTLRYFRHFQFRKRDFHKTPETLFGIRFVYYRPRLAFRDRKIEIPLTYLESPPDAYYVYECNESGQNHFQNRYYIFRSRLPA